MNNEKLLIPEYTRVILHSLGESTPGEYRGVILGIASYHPNMVVYIVELIDRIDPNYQYNCIVITEHCLKLDFSGGC